MRPSRIFAPLALVAAAVAILMIVDANLGDSGSDKDKTTTGSSQTATNATKGKGKTKHKKRVYVVKNGDVLSAISIKTNVPLAEIERLNPNLDAQSLHAGEKIKLSE